MSVRDLPCNPEEKLTIIKVSFYRADALPVTHPIASDSDVVVNLCLEHCLSLALPSLPCPYLFPPFNPFPSHFPFLPRPILPFHHSCSSLISSSESGETWSSPVEKKIEISHCCR